MGKLCVYDPEKLSRVCFDKNNLNLSLSKKGIKHFKKAQKLYTKKSSMSKEEKEKFREFMQSSISAKLSVTENDVEAATCMTGKDRDQLVILHPLKSIKQGTFNSSLLPIALKKGSCKTITKKTFLKNKMQTKEIFLDLAKKELDALK